MCPASSTAERLRVQRRADHQPGPVVQPAHQRRDAGVPRVRDQHHREVLLPATLGGAADPGLERRDHRLAVREHVRVVPLGRGQDDDVGPVRVEVAGVLVRLHDELHAATRGVRSPATPMPVTAAGSSAPTNAPGSPPAPTSTWTSQPGGRALAVRPRDRDQHAARGRVGDDLLPRLERDPEGPGRDELRVVRVDGRQRLGDGQPARARLTGDVGRVVARGDRDARRIERRRVLGRAARVAAVHVGARPRGQQRRRGGARALGADDVDPLAGPDRPRRTGGRQPGADLGRPAHAHARSSPRRLREEHLEGRLRARALVLAAIAGPQEPPDHRRSAPGDGDVGEADRLRLGAAVRARRPP